MPHAVRLTQETVKNVSTRTALPLEAVQALFEYFDSLQQIVYIVTGLTGLSGQPISWMHFQDSYFNEHFTFPYGENIDKFQPVDRI